MHRGRTRTGSGGSGQDSRGAPCAAPPQAPGPVTPDCAGYALAGKWLIIGALSTLSDDTFEIKTLTAADLAPLPEPGSLVLLGAGLMVVGLWGRERLFSGIRN